MCSKIKIATAFFSVQAKDISTTGGARPSFCSEGNKHSSKENARNLHFRLRTAGVVLKETFFSPCFLPASLQDPQHLAAPPSLSAKPSLNASLPPAKANNKLRIYVQSDIWLQGPGTEG